MATTSSSCVKIIANDDDNSFDILLRQLAKDMEAKRLTKAIARYRWVNFIPVFCVLYNKPTYIVKFREFKREMEFCNIPWGASNLSRSCNVIELANALKFEECAKELEKMYVKLAQVDARCIPDFDLFTCVINIGKLHVILANNGAICRTIKRLCQNGRNILARGQNGESVLHVAVLNMSPYDIFHTIISEGVNVDCTDKFGTSAFSSFIGKAIYFELRMTEVVKILKLFLSQNPCISTNKEVIKQALEYDKRKCQDVFRISLADDDEAQKTDTKYMNAREMCLLPWLYGFGFPVTQEDIDEVQLETSGEKPLFNIHFNDPRQLKDLARIKIRKTYPGTKLHLVVKEIQIPSTLKEYILVQ